MFLAQGINGQCDGDVFPGPERCLVRDQAQVEQNPGAGATVQAQLWFRDPASTSNQTTALSDALEFGVAP